MIRWSKAVPAGRRGGLGGAGPGTVTPSRAESVSHGDRTAVLPPLRGPAGREAAAAAAAAPGRVPTARPQVFGRRLMLRRPSITGP